jgi:DNA-directed RNA polymerase specialized sigma24 family protein
LLSIDDDPTGMLAPSRSDPAPGIDDAVDLQAALLQLTVDQRTLLALHYALDLSIREVARTLGVPEGTAKTRLNAALVALRRSLSEPHSLSEANRDRPSGPAGASAPGNLAQSPGRPATGFPVR